MKKILSIFGIMSVLFMFNACSEKEGTLFDYGGKDYWSFRSNEESITTNATGKSEVYIYHLNSTAITPVNVTVNYGENSEGKFTVSTTSINAVDADSKAAIEITYKLEDLEFNVPYTLEISVPKQDSYPFEKGLIETVSITVIRPLTFTKLGECSLNSTWKGREYPVQIEKANEGDIYKIIAPYAKDYNMLIFVNGNAATVSAQQVDLVSGVAPVIVNGTGTFANNVITLTLDFIMYYPANTVYYQELGDIEEITLP